MDKLVIILLIFCSASILSAQFPVQCLSAAQGQALCDTNLGNRKTIPEEIKSQVLNALSCYPELKESKIIFQFRNRITPLSTRPRLMGLIRKRKQRTYIITISKNTIKQIRPILFKNLPYNAQIGVLGHELAHLVEFNNKTSFQLIRLFFKKFKSSNTDRFEFNTDLACINHGLGFQLFDWSKYVRESLQIKEWKGAASDGNAEKLNQRYMNPETINLYIKKNDLYMSIRN
ncbi:MAG: hypothetical protein PSX36_15480 [bacterium]|nr:hypothetical protein [bacterium]